MCKSPDTPVLHRLIACLTLVTDSASFVAAIALLAAFHWDAKGDKLVHSVDEWLLGWLIVGLVISCGGIVVTVLDIYGIFKSRYNFMRPFLFYLVVRAVTFGFFAVAFLVLIILLATSEKRQDAHEQNLVRSHLALSIAAGVVSAVVAALSAYFCFVVRSHIKKGKSNKTMPKNILDERMRGRRFSWEVYSPIIKKPPYPDLVKINPS